jgi:type IV pilus assembly protein PilB
MSLLSLIEADQFLDERTPASQRLRASELVLERTVGQLGVEPGHRVLEVGTGCGVVAAVLAKLGATVWTIEADIDQANVAQIKLTGTGVHVMRGPGELGLPEHAPFDAILVSARVPAIPPALKSQLKVGGTLVATVGQYRVRQRLVRVSRLEDSAFVEEDLGEVRFGNDLSEILQELGAASAEDIEAASESSDPLEVVLLRNLQVREDDLILAKSLQHGMRVAEVEDLLQGMDPTLCGQLSPRYLQAGTLLPIQLRGGVLTLAVTDPMADTRSVGVALGASQVVPYLISRTSLKRLRAALELDRIDPRDLRPLAIGPELLEGASHPNIALFEALLLEAIGQAASDIHLERYGDQTRVRMRVDGVLEDSGRFNLSADEHAHLINILKVSSGMDITEHFMPQGGRFSRSAGQRGVDMRVQIQPTFDGENAVIRVLSSAAEAFGVDDLGFPPELAQVYDRLIDEPNGLVLITGPTGSGKTTTLYAALQKLSRDAGRKVLTVEDPVEYSLFGVPQIQTRNGFGFADAMRSFVRQDPDVIFVGEIRDPDTALETLRASQTGHLVLSSVHCNDAVDSVQRLRDLGMAPSSISSELMAVASQRLVRRNCPDCRMVDSPSLAALNEIFPEGVPEGARLLCGSGCARCHGRGTLGRLPLVELWVLNPEQRAAIAGSMSVHDLRTMAVAHGLVPLRKRGQELVASGEVSVAECRRQLSAEQLAPQ